MLNRSTVLRLTVMFDSREIFFFQTPHQESSTLSGFPLGPTITFVVFLEWTRLFRLLLLSDTILVMSAPIIKLKSLVLQFVRGDRQKLQTLNRCHNSKSAWNTFASRSIKTRYWLLNFRTNLPILVEGEKSIGSSAGHD